MGPNNWGIFLILPVATGEGIGPAGEISPVVCMLKNGLVQCKLRAEHVFIDESVRDIGNSLTKYGIKTIMIFSTWHQSRNLASIESAWDSNSTLVETRFEKEASTYCCSCLRH